MWYIWRMSIGFASAVVIASTCELAGMPARMSLVLGLAILMIAWWLDGAVSAGVTGLLPLVFLPLMGITKASEICESYFSDGIVICFGSLLMANAIEEYNLHEYFAHKMIRLTSSLGQRGILLGFIIVTGMLSMWLSNTATAALMTPLSKAVFSKLRAKAAPSGCPTTRSNDIGINCDSEEELSTLGTTRRSTTNNRDADIMNEINLTASATDLSIAYAATIGGMATITGTGANIALVGIMQLTYGDEYGSISFLNWMVIFTPLTIINLGLLFGILSLCIKFYPHRLDKYYAESTNLNYIKSKSTKAAAKDDSAPSSKGESESELDIPLDFRDNVHNNDMNNSSDLSNCNSNSNIIDTLSYKEYCVLSSFILMTTLWVTRDPPGGWGWSLALPEPDFISDGTVAIACSLLLFILPRDPKPFLLVAQKLKSMLQLSSYVALSDSSSHTGIQLNSTNSDMNSQFAENPFKDVEDHVSSPLNSPGHRRAALKLEISESIRLAEATGKLKERGQAGKDSRVQVENENDKKNKNETSGILKWKVITNMNWDIIFLLGGGFALSKGFQDSGLSAFLTNKFLSDDMSFLGILLISSIISCAMTNVMSNVAVANIVLPAIACIAPSMGKHPLLLLAPVTLCISLALLFPIGTPPNAIVMSNGNVSVVFMGVVGSACTVIFLVTILLYNFFVTPQLLHYLEEEKMTNISQFIDICLERD